MMNSTHKLLSDLWSIWNIAIHLIRQSMLWGLERETSFIVLMDRAEGGDAGSGMVRYLEVVDSGTVKRGPLQMC